jgi:hypothetical protein
LGCSFFICKYLLCQLEEHGHSFVFFERVRECIYSLQLFYWQTLKKTGFC